jgi:hypothetical protein
MRCLHSWLQCVFADSIVSLPPYQFASDRIIDPYGGLIRPKLCCSFPPGNDAQALQVVAVQFDGRHPHAS